MEVKSDIAREYLEVHAKYTAKYGDRIVVLYQIGDFYEMYGIESQLYKICYETLDIQFRKIPTETSLYTGGFPLKAINKYVKLLLQRDYLIVICNQEDSPSKKGKKIRVVSEILSKATSTDEEVLNTDSALLMSMFLEYDEGKLSESSICHIDISTGKLICITDGISSYDEIVKILRKLNPKQILINTEGCKNSKDELIQCLQLEGKLTHVYLNAIDKAFKKPAYANTFFSNYYPQKMLTHIEYLGLEKYPSLIVALILMLAFISDFNKNLLTKLSKPHFESYKGQLVLSENAITQLHLLGDVGNVGLFNILDRSCTPGGKRLLKKMLLNPITDSKILEQRYETISKMCAVYPNYRNNLSKIKDLERLHRKISLGTLQPQEFYYLHESYLAVVNLIKLCETDVICTHCIPEIAKTYFYELIHEYTGVLIPDNLKDVTFKVNIENPVFKTGVYKDLDKIWEQYNSSRTELNTISAQLGQHTGDEPIKIDYSVSYGYFLIAPKSRKSKLSGLGLEFKETGSNIKIFNSRITELSDIMVNTIESIRKVSEQYFKEYLENVYTKYSSILEVIATYINYLDVVASVAYVSVTNKYCRPQIIEREKAYVTGKKIRHPIIEKNIAVKYVENDVNLGVDIDGMMLYSMNSAGKSSYGRSVGINIILAQAGFFVAAESFIFKPYHNIITKIAVLDNIHKSKSTFMNEMAILANIVDNATENTMVISDELSSGSEHESAVAISATTILELSKRKTNFIFITHLHELVDIDEIKELKNIGIFHLNVIINEKTRDVTFDRKLIPNKCQSNYGIEIASYAGLDKNFINTAYKIRDKFKNINNRINTKTSKYNSQLYMNECKICKVKPTDELPLDTHHITEQCEFRKDHNFNFGKDDIFNLVPLCKKCHTEVHQKKYKIHGYVETGSGIVLNYETL